jgi:hypothetical protein
MDIFIFLKVMKVLSLSSFLFYSVISLFFFYLEGCLDE